MAAQYPSADVFQSVKKDAEIAADDALRDLKSYFNSKAPPSARRRLTALAADRSKYRSNDPPNYHIDDTLADLRMWASEFMARMATTWPDALSDVSEIGMLRDILELLEAPSEFRSKVRDAFIRSELDLHRNFFDRIEARPLTDEQCKAVIVDEQRNLVVAAAGSGKTSVIVAKTAWLVHRGYRKPSELLLLAFAQDARNEMEERIGRRLGAAAHGVTVRTFHGLGMEIIGDAEGTRPALARSAEDRWAFFGQLKGT